MSKYISEELFKLLVDHGILIHEESPEWDKTDPDWLRKAIEWDRDYNVKWTSDWYAGKHTEVGDRYVLNPLVPKFPASLRFEDVATRQEHSNVLTRKDVDITSEFCRGVSLKIPIISANMSTVTNASMALAMRKAGGVGIVHRAWQSWSDYLEHLVKTEDFYNEFEIACVSIGIGYDQLELAKRLINNADYQQHVITIDVAQGYSDEIKLLAKSIKRYSSSTKIIVGNVVNPSAIEFYNDVADAVKIGVGQGYVCTTKSTAGSTEGQFTAVYRCAKVAKKLGMPIISDGGVSKPSDFVLAIGAGASTVMCGKVLAACEESAAEVVEVGSVKKKKYYGMASRENQEKWRGKVHNDCPEGKTVLLDIGEPVAKLVERYAGALRSGISYVGATNIKEFQEKVKFVRVANDV